MRGVVRISQSVFALALQRITVGMFAGIILAVSGTAHAQSLGAQVGFSIDDRTSNSGTTGPVTAAGPERTELRRRRPITDSCTSSAP